MSSVFQLIRFQEVVSRKLIWSLQMINFHLSLILLKTLMN